MATLSKGKSMERTLNRVFGIPLVIGLVALGAAGCAVQSQEPSEFQGPSELAESAACKPASGGTDPTVSQFCTITITATPDRLPQDGSSQSVITATVTDENSKPKANVSLRWIVSASDGSLVVPSVQIGSTDVNGRATTVITAPDPPPQLASSAVRLRVEVEPVGADSQAVFNDPSIPRRSVVVELVPPGGTLPNNQAPVAAFTVVPSIANVNESVTFNAQTTFDEGVPCLSRCSYLWNFGDNSTGSGMTVTHSYLIPQAYTVTLTVTDERGGVGSTTRSLTVSGPAAPVALFAVTPASPAAGANAVFNATTSTVGAGATITQYVWNFGDGTSSVTSTSPVITRSFAVAGTYAVTLTITDSFGRTSTRIVAVTVT